MRERCVVQEMNHTTQTNCFTGVLGCGGSQLAGSCAIRGLDDASVTSETSVRVSIVCVESWYLQLSCRFPLLKFAVVVLAELKRRFTLKAVNHKTPGSRVMLRRGPKLYVSVLITMPLYGQTLDVN